MLAKFITTGFLFLSGCSFLPFLKQMPFEIKASIEGEIKGHRIHCEKTLKIAEGKWAFMCGVGNDTDVKYRVRSINDTEAQVEFLISKDKEGEQKIIAAPALFIKTARSTQSVTTTNTANIIVSVERIR
jgi:hypothetical protein